MSDTFQRDIAIECSLRQAYGAALKDSHGGARVEIHLGSAVTRYLRDILANDPNYRTLDLEPAMWGFPVVEHENYLPEHIAIHTVRVIA